MGTKRRAHPEHQAAANVPSSASQTKADYCCLIMRTLMLDLACITLWSWNPCASAICQMARCSSLSRWTKKVHWRHTSCRKQLVVTATSSCAQPCPATYQVVPATMHVPPATSRSCRHNQNAASLGRSDAAVATTGTPQASAVTLPGR
jgi:hypothetical protein